jgi:hypothetical protein
MPKEGYHSDESVASLQVAARELKNIADRALRAGDSNLGITSTELALRLSCIFQGFTPFKSTEVFVDWLRSSVVRREPRPRRLPRAGERET